MDSLLVWQYNDIQVGTLFRLTDPTPNTITRNEDGIMFTVSYISNDNGILVSSLSFIADTATNRQTITCVGTGNNRENEIVQAGNGKDHRPCMYMFLI